MTDRSRWVNIFLFPLEGATGITQRNETKRNETKRIHVAVRDEGQPQELQAAHKIIGDTRPPDEAPRPHGAWSERAL